MEGEEEAAAAAKKIRHLAKKLSDFAAAAARAHTAVSQKLFPRRRFYLHVDIENENRKG